MEFELPSTAERQSAGTIVAYLFFMREVVRKERSLELQPLKDLLTLYGCPFRDLNSEMDWMAELKHFRYYPIGDFDALCYRCIDFSNIIQQPLPHSPEGHRGIPKIICKCWKCAK